MTNLTGSNLGQLLTQAQVLERWPDLSADELKRARESKSVRHLKAKRTFWYHPDWIAEYLAANAQEARQAEADRQDAAEADRRARAILERRRNSMSQADGDAAADLCAKKILGKR